ncbi:uncharacterized protein LOC119178046 isoform X6 [Rhipicephalus microplus]|uniref:uncharacterized protein LOC119178046 isoform X6 n=1 Tax=Rhipicephalus microplus TaxID=6941 RepID=UPI003F6B2D0D
MASQALGEAASHESPTVALVTTRILQRSNRADFEAGCSGQPWPNVFGTQSGCRELMHLNVVLRRNLEITTRTNEELTSEVHELTEEWRQADRSRNGNRPQGLQSRLSVMSQCQQDLAELRQDLAQLRQAVCTHFSHLKVGLETALAQLITTSADRCNLSQQIAEDLNRQIEVLNAENDRLQLALDQAGHLAQDQGHALDRSSCEVDSLRSQVSELQAKLTILNDACQKSRNEESHLQVQLNQQRTSALHELEALRTALHHTQELNNQLAAERDAQQESSEQLERQARESTVRLKSLLRESESHQAELRQKLTSKHHELLSAQTAHLEATSFAEALSKEVGELKEQLSVERREREAQAEKQAEDLAWQVASQEKLQQQARSDKEALEKALQRAQARADAQADTCRRACSDVDALQARLAEERSSHQEVLAKHDQALACVQSEHRKEVQRLRVEHEATVSRILKEQGRLRHELSEKLQQQIQSIADREKSLREETDAFCKKIELLEVHGQQTQAAHEEERKLLGQGLAQCRSQLRTLHPELTALKEEVTQARLEAHLSCLREAFTHLGQRERSLQHCLRQADERATHLQHDLEQAGLRIAKLEAEIAIETRQLLETRRLSEEERDQLHRLVGDLRESIDQAKIEKDAAHRDAANTFREMETLRAELAAECARLREQHQEEQRVLRAEAEARLQRERAFWKAKVSLCDSEMRAVRAEASQLQEQLREVQEQLVLDQASHQAQAGQAALQRTQDQTDWQRHLLHKGQELHQLRLAVSTAQGKTSALEAHLEAVAESRQRAEAALSSLLSALRSALGVTPHEAEAGGTEEGQLVVGAVQGLMGKVVSLANDKDKLEAEAEQCRRKQQELQTQLVATAGDLRRHEAARKRLSAENVELHQQTCQQLEEASRLRLELQTVQLERSSLQDQLEESRRQLELQAQQLERLKASSRNQLLDARLSEKEAELQLARARLERLQQYLAVSHTQQHKRAEKGLDLSRTAGGATSYKVERLQEQLALEKQRSQRLAEREHELEAQLQEAQSQATTLHERSQRICTELETMRQEKSSLEAKFSAVAVQLAESEAAKQRLYRQKTPASADESQRILEQNHWLRQEADRLRYQLSRTVKTMLAPQPRTSTPKKREGPEGQSLHHAPKAPPGISVHQLEAHMHTTLQITPLPLDASCGSHVDADQSSQAFRVVLGLCTMETVLVLILLVVALVRVLVGDAPVVQPGYTAWIPGCHCC